MPLKNLYIGLLVKINNFKYDIIIRRHDRLEMVSESKNRRASGGKRQKLLSKAVKKEESDARV